MTKKRSEATQTLRAGCSKADPQTNTQTDRGDYNTLRSLAHSVITSNDYQSVQYALLFVHCICDNLGTYGLCDEYDIDAFWRPMV